MKKLLGLTGLLVALLLAVVLVNTLRFSPDPPVAAEPVALDVEQAGVTRRMAEAIRFPTISTGDDATQDFQAFDAFLGWLKASYPLVQTEIPLEMIADYTLLYRWQGSDPALKPILLTAHYDVVPVVSGSESDWKYPPFSGEVAEGYVWGRGALDDKSGVIVMLEAATELLKEGFVPERTVYFSFGHDEEIGGMTGAGGVAERLQREGVQLAWSLDEGSFIIDSGMLPGIERPIASINVAEKGSVTLDLTAHGPGGHSSMPGAELSIDILAQALVNLRSRPVPGGLEGVSAEMFEGIARNGSFWLRMLVANQWLFGSLLEKQLGASPSMDAMLRTTTAPTILRSGIKQNVVPPTATAVVNFRLHPRDTADSVKAHVEQAIADERVQVDIRGGGFGGPASAVSSRDSAGYEALARVSRQVFGDVIVVPGLTVGGTDSKHYSRVADDSYRLQYMLVGPEDIAGFHGTNERVAIDNLVKGTTAYYYLLKQAAGPTLP